MLDQNGTINPNQNGDQTVQIYTTTVPNNNLNDNLNNDIQDTNNSIWPTVAIIVIIVIITVIVINLLKDTNKSGK